MQVSVALSGYMIASMFVGASANYSYPLFYDTGAGVQDHFINWKVQRLLLSHPCMAPLLPDPTVAVLSGLLRVLRRGAGRHPGAAA